MNETPGRTRRSFLRVGLLAGASALASARFIGRGLAGADSATDASTRLPNCEATILVLIQLSGGNDGLNTVIPFTDDTYFAFRPGLAIPPSRVLKISDNFALNGMLTGVRELYDLGELALILGVGYPTPSLSHFRAREIWRTACDSEDEPRSWLARALDARRILSWEDILRMARRIRPSARYPCSQLASGLEFVSRLVSAGTPVRAFCLCQGGYDTHAGQMNSHPRLLKELDSAMRAFVADLKAQGNFTRVLIMIFSEFGRGLVENHHGGTEHGSAAPMLIAGGAIGGGVYGEQPSLASLSAGELVHGIDFRSVYTTVLEKWLHVQSRGVLRRKFPMLEFL